MSVVTCRKSAVSVDDGGLDVRREGIFLSFSCQRDVKMEDILADPELGIERNRRVVAEISRRD
jgi:hypothetical protein